MAEMGLAMWFGVLLLLAWFWRQMLKYVVEGWRWWRVKVPGNVRGFLQYYTLLYLALQVHLVVDAYHSYMDLRECSFTGTRLGRMALGTPLCVLGSTIVCGYHIWRHHLAIMHTSGGLISTCGQRDSTIQVLFLPLVYSRMAFSAVVILLQDVADCDGREGFSEYATQRQAEFYAVADLYEAYALYEFVMLSLEEISHYSEEREKECLESIAPGLTKMGEKAAEHIKLVNKALGSVTMQGVLWFVFSCLVDSCYKVIVTAEERRANFHVPAWAEGYESQLYVMGLITSTAAIGDVVSVETGLIHCMEDFNCEMKFISVKIMVSIAFFQGGIISLIARPCGLTENESHLLYSVLICYEVLALSFFHLAAWPEHEAWLQNTEMGRRQARLGISCSLQLRGTLRRFITKLRARLEVHKRTVTRWDLGCAWHPQRKMIRKSMVRWAKSSRQQVQSGKTQSSGDRWSMLEWCWSRCIAMRRLVKWVRSCRRIRTVDEPDTGPVDERNYELLIPQKIKILGPGAEKARDFRATL